MTRAETRREWGRVSALAGLLGALAQVPGTAAQPLVTDSLPRLSLVLPSELHPNEHALVTLEVELPAHAGQPLLLTPFREGESIEIVRGRLLRSDARDSTANPLRFELPILAHAPGAAVVGVKLLAYLCTPRCRAVEVETRRNVVVLPR